MTDTSSKLAKLSAWQGSQKRPEPQGSEEMTINNGWPGGELTAPDLPAEEGAKRFDFPGLPEGPWEAIKSLGGAAWYILDRDHVTLADFIREESVARAIASIPDMLAAAAELDRLCLVIESAVSITDPAHHAAVVALLKANRAALAKAKAPAKAIKPI